MAIKIPSHNDQMREKEEMAQWEKDDLEKDVKRLKAENKKLRDLLDECRVKLPEGYEVLIDKCWDATLPD